jgi:hypothetical protein
MTLSDRRLLLLLTILILSLLILPFAWAHAVTVSSFSTASIPKLWLYEIFLPLASILHISIEYVLTTLWGSHLEMTANLSALALSVVFSYGWIINNGFWTRCEFAETDWGACPFKSPTRVYDSSIFKIVFAWMVVSVYLTYDLSLARLIRAANKKAQGVTKVCQ